MRRPTIVIATAVLIAANAHLSAAVVASREPFQFGLEYLVPGLAATYAQVGATWGKPAPAGFDWGAIEVMPPVNGVHRYDWSFTDRLIREWQEAGFRNFQIYLQCRSPWATSKPLPPRGHPSAPPKPEFLGDYAAYLRSIVERYDGDGHEDMPGLRYPIRYWEIEAEWGTFWLGTLQEYVDLLRLARQVIKEADPQAQIILQGILLWGIFEGEPDEMEMSRRLTAPLFGPGRRQILAEVGRLLAHPELFDVVDYHSLSDWTELPGVLRFLRGEMHKHGYQRPVWAGDVNFNINPMLWWDQPNYPYVTAQKPAIREWLRAMKQRNHPRHAEAERWFRAEQASFMTKKVVACMGEGYAGINMGNLEDWEIFAWLPTMTGTGGFQGLIDRKPPRTIDEDRVPGTPRPAFWTLKLLISKLQGCQAGTRLSVGPGVYAYRFVPPAVPGRPRAILVVWYEDGTGQLPGDPEPTAWASIPTASGRVTETAIITQTGKQTAESREVRVAEGRIELEVKETPVVLEEW